MLFILQGRALDSIVNTISPISDKVIMTINLFAVNPNNNNEEISYKDVRRYKITTL